MLNLEEKGKEAFKIHNSIVDNERMRRALLAVNAELLQEMLGKGLYKIYLGDMSAEPAAYLSQIEVFYSRNQISRLRAAYRLFRERFGMDLATVFDIPDSRLYDVIKVAKEENIDELLGFARHMLPRDWRNHIRSLKKLPTTENCNHHRFTDYAICIDCGDKIRK